MPLPRYAPPISSTRLSVIVNNAISAILHGNTADSDKTCSLNYTSETYLQILTLDNYNIVTIHAERSEKRRCLPYATLRISIRVQKKSATYNEPHKS